MNKHGTTQHQLRALVVDDRNDVAMGLALLLKQLGYPVKVANQARDALEFGERFRPDVVFLDIGLPDLSGYDVCLEMRRRDWGAKAFIVAVTGRDDAADVMRAANTGFDRHVAKPMSFGTLREILRTVESEVA
ncbi:MAG TPA: response regulator [Flavobacteriales bacterium]|nr:response regulator [Flavobacteriales bacterium]